MTDETTIVEAGVILKAEDFELALKELQKAHSSSIGAPQVRPLLHQSPAGKTTVTSEPRR